MTSLLILTVGTGTTGQHSNLARFGQPAPQLRNALFLARAQRFTTHLIHT